MAQTNSRFFSLMVVGEKPYELVEKYSSNYKVEPYVKYKYLDAEKYKNVAIKTLTKLLENSDKIGIDGNIKEALKQRLEIITKLSPFDYYRELTNGLYYNENGDAISDENKDAKYNTCRIGRNFSLPLKLKDGSEAYSAKSQDIDWERMHRANPKPYEAAWEIVVEGREPNKDDEEEMNIYNSMKDKKTYFGHFPSKKAYVDYSTAYWNYAYADKNGWLDMDDEGDNEKWINGFYDRFVSGIKFDDLVTIFECSVNDG